MSGLILWAVVFLYNITVYASLITSLQSYNVLSLSQKQRICILGNTMAGEKEKGKEESRKVGKGIVEHSKFETNTKSTYARFQNTVTY